ncbi:OX-2 membrane glycoprotein-like [Cottoperca gobio]|uniref:OX-2 membrane glycoprotein-like n=1 Tax=Cottoperca gobio TaxID=56716 RepID=A0A6J2R7V0_COTGO|nr:OX-2 membrane glycoprotein-like [Cottoperca gobio]
MSNFAALRLIFVSWVFQKGLTALIKTQHIVLAAVGEDSSLSCQLMQPKDVLQVTWQKSLPEGMKNVASYSKHFGPGVNDCFQGKVDLEAAGLQNCSIVIRNLTEQDEGCYHCLFNTYPEGALTGTTCLQIYELHEPILHVGESNSAEEALVSCSATGRPALTVTLTVPHYNSTSVTNTNGTVTVTATARLPDESTQVGCAARVLSAPQKEVFVMIPEVKQSPAGDLTLNIVVSVILACVCLCVCVCLCCCSHRLPA